MAKERKTLDPNRDVYVDDRPVYKAPEPRFVVPPNPPGRPKTYDFELCQYICGRIANGEPLSRILKDPGMPMANTIYGWIAAHPEFEKIYIMARSDQADTLADEIIQIADDSSCDKYIDEEGNEKVNSEHINRSRLRVDTRKWVASKLKPKRYGERVQQEVSGPDGGDIVTSLVIKFESPEKK